MRIFLISFIFLSAIFQICCFPDGRPEGRGGQESVQVKEKLYFMGGSRLVPFSNPKKYNLSDEVFYLDLSSQFDIENPPFIDLTNGTSRMFYGNEKGTAILGGSDQSTIYLIGGTQVNLTTINWNLSTQLINWNATDQFIYIYKTVPKVWTKLGQGVKGIQPSRRRSTSTVIKPNGTIYIFGGRVELDMASNTLILYNDLYQFDTILLSWNPIIAPNKPSPRSHSAAILLPNGKIIYIGGVSQDAPGSQTNLINMTETAISSISIQPRVGHTAVLTPDNSSIIIMGGTSSYELNQTTVYPSFLKLDIQSEPFQYSELNTSGINKPPPLSFHRNITNDITDSNETSSNVYLLYIPCLTWESTFIPGRSDCQNNSAGNGSNHGNENNLKTIIGCSITAFVFCSFIVTAIVLCILHKNGKFKDKNLGCFKIGRSGIVKNNEQLEQLE
ncbi:4266_t:CDS:2 [Dentiscutata erythropus]|uniref:4266_t:CDS:1 n=1 Tax=Dentiscutata erythropus TaxID=1348616 RepID=A0A9N8ZJH3_9GLOM|nr:4266_t:CDS:2 [Dentiscutata erythropus]